MTVQPESAPVPVLESSLGSIRGVDAARIVMSPTLGIEEIHVIGQPVRSPKQVVRDVQTVLLVQHGIRIDHRKVSLVQIDMQRLPASPPRIILRDVALDTTVEQPCVAVTLAWKDSLVQGLGQSRVERPLSVEELTGYATVHALDQIVPPQARLRLEQLERHAMDSHEVCIAHLSLIDDESVEMLFGISVISGDSLSAAARAVLDATNRRLPRLLNGKD